MSEKKKKKMSKIGGIAAQEAQKMGVWAAKYVFENVVKCTINLPVGFAFSRFYSSTKKLAENLICTNYHVRNKDIIEIAIETYKKHVTKKAKAYLKNNPDADDKYKQVSLGPIGPYSPTYTIPGTISSNTVFFNNYYEFGNR